jgi:hypothetical protein
VNCFFCQIKKIESGKRRGHSIFLEDLAGVVTLTTEKDIVTVILNNQQYGTVELQL